ncbi:pectin lyase-like superfamily protein [Actinidia rufa]|uniref:Pectin lyase-like superfamily protein n=1 Tax=Actinidia rufa TaxID=165716 RepID=A0A7J0H038_9ERIC|nr:pectin lyase-like superfamily protein [Actinidia rufa]
MHRFVSSILLCFAAVASFMNLWALADVVTCSGIVPMRERSDSVSEFGGVGDGVTVNMEPFRASEVWWRHASVHTFWGVFDREL